MSSVLLLLSQALPPWACPPVAPVQTLGGSPLFSWGRGPRLCCFTAGEGERTGNLSNDWDSVGTSQPAGYWAWLWVLWHVGLALQSFALPLTPWSWAWLQPEVGDRDVYVYIYIYIYIFWFLNSFWRTVRLLHNRNYNNTITHILISYIMCVYMPSCKSFLYTQPWPAKVGVNYCPCFADKPQRRLRAPAPDVRHSSWQGHGSPGWIFFFFFYLHSARPHF